MSDVSRKLVEQLAAGGFVSGEHMAASLGVSRAAVNQHVARLRDRGVVVHSVRGRGYRLERPLELLDETLIRAGLGARAARQLAMIEVLDAVPSTNRTLREARAGGRAIDACFAEYQGEGRGRRGRTWVAAAYGSILMSLAHELPGGPAASAGLSLAAGIAAARAAGRCGCPDVALKWPNDLMLGGAKCGGILVEIAGELGERCHAIVGVGINVTMPSALAASVGQPVAALADHAVGAVSRNQLAAALASALVEVLGDFNRDGFAPFVREWTTLHASQDAPVRVVLGEETITGTARGVADDGALLIETGAGAVRRITTGEVMS